MGYDSAEEEGKCFNTMDTFLTGDLGSDPRGSVGSSSPSVIAAGDGLAFAFVFFHM